MHDFMSRFKVRNGSIICREVLDCNINTEPGRALANRTGIFGTVCPKLVHEAARILDDS